MTTPADSQNRRASDQRPSALTEVRAWIIVAITFVAQLITAVWWAASLSADIKTANSQLSEVRTAQTRYYTTAEAEKEIARLQQQITAHDTKIQQLEAFRVEMAFLLRNKN